MRSTVADREETHSDRSLAKSTGTRLGIVAAGAFSGGLAAISYYVAGLEWLAHGFLVWVVLGVTTTAGHTLRTAVRRATAVLLTGVLVFYLGRQWIHVLEYPGADYAVDPERMAAWLVLAVLAGIACGTVFRHIGREGWSAAIATTTAIGILLGDLARELYPSLRVEPVFAVCTSLVVLVILLLAVGSKRQFGRIALLVLPCAVGGMALLVASELLERLAW
ncbi:hypothetical protein SAMN04487905_11271 [Actinopolyspora xinjiangensis]|uniref:Uncharacterized protein n=1 Tax=Actinopolyspora xinjiangensis TaxID=405564 RepID=A0A1H0WHX0_9ACTN|nr:hypothetical protein [Actinopolyspora xinjiangensis]SDP89876.1 hypothetical protein SAMN04487905_11271 [Actinopolyspora xinjiangensis]